MNILEEFWYGNIEPAEYDTSSIKTLDFERNPVFFLLLQVK